MLLNVSNAVPVGHSQESDILDVTKTSLQPPAVVLFFSTPAELFSLYVADVQGLVRASAEPLLLGSTQCCMIWPLPTSSPSTLNALPLLALLS